MGKGLSILSQALVIKLLNQPPRSERETQLILKRETEVAGSCSLAN